MTTIRNIIDIGIKNLTTNMHMRLTLTHALAQSILTKYNLSAEGRELTLEKNNHTWTFLT